MYVSNMKRNARKSTHSGKVRQTSSTFQDFQSTSSHSALNHNSNLAPSPLHSRDRSIWDTEFTAPEPTWHDSSNNVICLTEEPAVMLKPIPGNLVKGCVASLKNKLKPDRNIFSALTKPANQHQRSFNSRPTTTKHTPAILHHPSKISRNFSKFYGSEFVFKKPTAPPPVSRVHLSSSSSRTSQPSPSRSTSTTQSGHVQNRQRNKHRDFSSETRRFTALPPKARSGAKRKPQYTSEINHRFRRDNIFGSRPFLEGNNWSSAFSGKLSSSKSKFSNVSSRLSGNDRSVFQTSQQWSQFSQPKNNFCTKSTRKLLPHKSVNSQATKNKFSANSETFVDLCSEKTVEKTHTVRLRSPRRSQVHVVNDPHYVTKMSIEALSRRRSSSAQKSVPLHKTQPSTNFLQNVQKSPNKQSSLQQKSSSCIGAGNKDTTRVTCNNSCSAVKVIPTEQLQFRLSPLKFETEDSGDFDEVDGLLFVSFKTQSRLESYLRTPPEKPVNRALSSNVLSPSASKPTSPREGKYKTRIEQFERQLKMEIQSNSNREILSPVLQHFGVSIRQNLLSKGTGSINLRSHGIRLYSKKQKRALRRRRRITEQRRKCKSKAESKTTNNSKEHTATRTTGLKIKFSVPGLHGKNNSLANETETVSKQDLEPDLASNSNSTSPEQTQEQHTLKAISNKLPIEESIPFKPFEKEVTSAKSAFISDALDKYLQDEKEHSPSSLMHPLLQNKASSVTFKMPSKQSSSFKTLDMALHQRQMARIKSKIPTVAQTAEKLAKKLHHYSTVNKITTEQADSSEKEKVSTETPFTSVSDKQTDSQHALKTEEGMETSFASGDQAITDADPKGINPKGKISFEERIESVKRNFTSALQKTRQIQTQHISRSDSKNKECSLEEKLETVKNKLKKTPALQKKSPVKSKSQTNWVTKFKIVNSRLVQQLNTPGQNAHLINSDKVDHTHPEQSKELPRAQEGEIKLEKNPEPSTNTTAAEGKRVKVESRDKGKEKNKSNKEFLRLDHHITCLKEFCRLGCICDSINLSLPVEQLTKHCRKASCMFECVCQRVTENVRILRNRKRPNIFQESSMLFYDGLGMFSNCAYSGPHSKPKKTGILQSLKPKAGGDNCARVTVYKGKPGAPNRTVRCQPRKVEEPKVQVSSGSVESQSQGLPKSVVDNTFSSNGFPQTISSIPLRLSDNKNETIQTVLYTPIKLPVPGQANPVVLYAPVNRLPAMTPVLTSSVIPRQQSEKEINGKAVQTQARTVESALPQIPLGNDSRIVDSKVKPVAVVSPSTAKTSNQENSDGKLATTLSRDPTGEPPKSLDGKMQKSSTISASTVYTSPEMPDLSTDLSHTAAPFSNEEDLSASDRENPATNLVVHTRNHANETMSLSSVKDIAEGAAGLAQPEPSKVSPDVSMATNKGELSVTNESMAAKQTPPMVSPKEATSDSLEDSSSNEGNETISAVISKIESPSSSQTIGTVGGLSPINGRHLNVSSNAKEISSGHKKADSASPKLSSTGMSEKTTSQTSPNNAILNLSKVLKTAPNGPTLDSGLKTCEAVTSTTASVTTQATTSKQKTSDPKNSTKVPAYSYVPRIEGSKKTSLTKTQVFLPGSSVSAINNKANVPASTRSSLLIEIQSECNWGNQREDILSSIAKHTASKEGASGVVRVGKFVVEILSKEAQMHAIPPMITCNTVSKTTTVNSQVQPLAAAKVQQLIQPTKIQPFVASAEPQAKVSTTIPESKAIDAVINTRPQAKNPVPELNPRPQLPFYQPSIYQPHHVRALPELFFPMPKQPPPTARQLLDGQKGVSLADAGSITTASHDGTVSLSTSLPQGSFLLSDGMNGKDKHQLPQTATQEKNSKKVVTLANAGTVTTAPHNGTVPLLTSLPPGSFLLSDGKYAAGYLVPLSAIKDHIVSSAADTLPQKQPTCTSISSFTSRSLLTDVTASQKSSISSSKHMPSLSTSSSPQLTLPTNCLPKVSGGTFDGTSTITSCPTSQVLGDHSLSPAHLGTGNLSSRSTETQTENGKCENGQNQLDDDHAFKPQLPELLEEGDLVINETSESDSTTKNKIVQPKDDLSGNNEDGFVDVESLSDSEEGGSLLKPLLKYSFANPTPATNMVTAQTTASSASSTLSSFSKLVKSRRKAPHVLRQPMQEVQVNDIESFDGPQHINQGIHVIGQHARAGSPVGSSKPPSSSKGKRKRKSPVIQKKSVLALDEPEFTESYFELTSDDEEEEDEQLQKPRRDKPNKVLHLIKERQRRQNQSDLFSELKVLMLNDEDAKVAKVTILGMALKEIKLLESKSFAIEVECAKLKQEHHLKRSKLASILGHSVMDFPLPLLDQKEQDFAEYSKDLHSSDGLLSATPSETASQDMDSECADLSSLEDDDYREAAMANRGVLMIEHKERVTTADDELDIVDVESHSPDDSYQTLVKPYPSSQYSLGDVVMSEPEPSSRFITKPVPVALSYESSINSSLTGGTKDTLPASIKADEAVEMQQELEGLSYKDSDLFSQDDPTLAFPMKLTAVSKSPASIEDDEEDSQASMSDLQSRLQDTVDQENVTRDSESPDCNTTNAEKTILKEHPMDVHSNNNNPLRQSSTSRSDDVLESIEGDNDITSQTESAPVENSEDGTLGPSTNPSVGSSDTGAKDTELPGDLSELSPRADDSKEPSTGSADQSVKYTELKEPPEPRVEESEPKDPVTIDVDGESESDGVEMVDSIPATPTSDSDDVILVNNDPLPSSGNKPAKKTTPTSPSKQNTSKLDSNKDRPPQGPTGPPIKLNVLAINIKGGIVRVTCDTGEVIPLAVVKASMDGTMQVAVEGDISSEKVEELLSKPEVMECLEKVADQACELLNK